MSHVNKIQYFNSLKPQIIQALQQINAQVEHIALHKRKIPPYDYFYHAIITSHDFKNIPQPRRQTDTERKLLNHLPKEIVKNLTYLTFTPEEYKAIEEDEG